MYKCRDCGAVFEEPCEYVERHGFKYGPSEHWSVCPVCGSGDYDDEEIVAREEGEE